MDEARIKNNRDEKVMQYLISKPEGRPMLK
jgi:hypothetical protein